MTSLYKLLNLILAKKKCKKFLKNEFNERNFLSKSFKYFSLSRKGSKIETIEIKVDN
jgi:hypothetical protein